MLILASASPRRRELIERLGRPFCTMESGYEERTEGLNLSAGEVPLWFARRKAEAAAQALHCGGAGQVCFPVTSAASGGTESCGNSEVCRAEAGETAAAADWRAQPDDLVIGADTAVICGDRLLGKPHSAQEAVEMLQLLSGRTHSVVTGIALRRVGALRGQENAALCNIPCGSQENIALCGGPHSELERSVPGRALRGGENSAQQEVCAFSMRTEVDFYELSDAEIRCYVDGREPMDKAGAYGIQGAGALFVRGIRGDFYNVIGLPVAELNRRLLALGI